MAFVELCFDNLQLRRRNQCIGKNQVQNLLQIKFLKSQHATLLLDSGRSSSVGLLQLNRQTVITLLKVIILGKKLPGSPS